MRTIGCFLLAILILALPAALTAQAPAVADAETSATASVEDDGAALFMGRCVGCHTIGGGARTGPDLSASARWKRPDLVSAIKRMEVKAGPMKDAEIETLTDLVQDPTARERLAAEEKKGLAAAQAALGPPSPETGRALFHGTRALANGGPVCGSCHAVQGTGGTLAVDLTAVASRLKGVALVSGIQNPGFPVMKPIYAARPITPQEAGHLAAYLESIPPNAPISQGPPVGPIGLAGAVGFLAFVAFLHRPRKIGTRERLVRDAHRR